MSNQSSSSYDRIERIRLGSKAFIVRDDTFLVIRERLNNRTPPRIIHDIPGGGLEPGEHPEAALKREVLEEVGLKVQVERLVGVWDFLVPSLTDPANGVHIVCLGYQCHLADQTPIITSDNPAEEDIFEWEWMTPDQVLKAGDSIFEVAAMREAVRQLHFS